MHDLEWIFDRARTLTERDGNLRKLQAAMDRMANLKYELPDELARLQWIRKAPSTAPYDAIRGATRALASLDERIVLHPASVHKALPAADDPDGQASREIANAWEVTLKWAMDKAARRYGSLRDDVIRSAVKYDEVCGQVVYLPAQVRALKKLGRDTRAYGEQIAYGDFMVLLKNPQCVHIVESPYRLEAVLCVEVQTGQDVKTFWGEDIAGHLDDDGDYTVFDYHSLEERAVWVIPGDTEDALTNYKPSDPEVTLILHDEWKYPFIPWAVKVGGDGLESDPANRRHPLLRPIYETELWVTASIVSSLAVSDTIATAAAPKQMVEGPAPESVEVDYTTPGGIVDVPPGHKYSPLPPPPIDQRHLALVQQLDQSMATATVSRVLVTAEALSGESFSGFNLRVKTAIGALLPYKSLGEAWFAEAYRIMLYCLRYYGGTLSGYGKATASKYTIAGEDVDPGACYLTVELTPDVPVDRLQQINGAVLLAQNLNLSPTYVLEFLGVTNPEGAMDDWARWQFWLAEVQGKIERVRAEAAGQYERDVMDAASALVEQQAQQMPPEMGMGEMPPEMMGQPPMPAPGGPMGMPGIGGPGFAPPMGGIPPALANPAANVREQQNGRDRTGEELA